MNVATNSAAAAAAQRQAFDRVLENHLLYCTVCDNNNGNCTVHNTTKMLAVEHQQIPFKPKPYEVDDTNPFYRYDPDQCLLCGRCVEACQNVEVNETLSINWDDEHPRVLWDGGSSIGESSCVSCGHCVTVCPCNALMEKSMLGHAGFFTALPKPALKGMIDIVKEVEPEMGFGAILKVSEAESAMRESRIRRTKTVCTYCGVGCSFDVWTKDRHILKIAPEHGPTNGISTCIKGKFGWDFVNSSDRLTTPLIREGDKFREASWDEALQLVARRLVGNQGRARARLACAHFLIQMHERGKLPDAEVGPRRGGHQQHRQLLSILPGAGHDGALPHGRLRRRLGFDPRYRKRRPGPHYRQQHGGEPSGARDASEKCPQTSRSKADRRRPARA